MPASDYGWMLSENKPLFQVYGTKRKHEGNDSSTTEEMVCESAGKRRCVPHEEQCINQTCDVEEINHNSLMSQNYNLNSPSVQTQQNLMSLSPSISVGQPQQQQEELIHQQLNHQQHQIPVTPMGDHVTHGETGLHQQNHCRSDNLIMDLHDETYSTVANVDICDVNQACIMMDSDFVPNPEQYKPTECNKVSGAGDNIVHSGRLGSFCRPSWEGHMEIGPYISDYY